MKKISKDPKKRRKKRVSGNIFGTKEKPRISPFLSNRFTYIQIIDDVQRKTLTSYSSLKLARSNKHSKGKKVDEAKIVGLELAKQARKLGVTKAIFDRGLYAYKGRVRALAEGLREGGLKI